MLKTEPLTEDKSISLLKNRVYCDIRDRGVKSVLTFNRITEYLEYCRYNYLKT